MSVFDDMFERLQYPASKVEGSWSADNLQAVANELERIQSEGIDQMPYKFFPQLAQGEDKTLAAANFGVERKPAEYATANLYITGRAGRVIDSDIRAMSEDIAFRVTQEGVIPSSGTITVLAQCETAGRIGNVLAGAIDAFAEGYDGLTSVTNPAAATGGVDEEDDDSLQIRLDARWKNPSTGGNAGDYIRWALSVPGVSRAVVDNPAAGSVVVNIIASGNQEADAALLTAVQSAIEEVCPLGASVIVQSGEAVPINVNAALVLQQGYTLDTVRPSIELALERIWYPSPFRIRW